MTNVLFILMRTDLDSMNCGKAMAQASHASNAFIHSFDTLPKENISTGLQIDVEYWRTETRQGFGTVLVLGGNMMDISETIHSFKVQNHLADIIHDPTYPIVDGSVVHHIPLDTCGYVFVPDKEKDITAFTLLSKYSLHP